MSWASSNKRMQYQGRGSQLNEAAAGDSRRQATRCTKYTRSNDHSILLDSASVNSQSRVRNGVRTQHSSIGIVAVHDGGGDAATDSNTGRAKARKSAQMEYKEQLDLQIAQQKEMRERERQKELQNVRSTPLRGPIVPQVPVATSTPLPIEPKSLSAVQCWLFPSGTSPVLITDKSTAAAFCPASPANVPEVVMKRSPTREVRRSSSPIPTPHLPTVSKSDQSCYRGNRKSRYHEEDRQSSYGNDGDEAEMSLPVGVSHSEPQLATSKHQRQSRSGHEEDHGRYSRSPKGQMSPRGQRSPKGQRSPRGQRSTGHEVVGPRMSRQNWEEMMARGQVYTVGSDGGVAVPVLLNPPDASVFSHTPPNGSSPCGSILGDSYHSGDSYNISFRQHISQTADQRPGTSVRNSAYKCALKQQIEEKRKEDEERRKREREEDERLQQKIQRDQERMLEEYEKEKQRFQEKEEEKRRKEEEVLERQKALIKEAEEAHRKAMEERRNRLSGSKQDLDQSEATNSQPPPIENLNDTKPRPLSPPIPTLMANKSPGIEIPEYPPEGYVPPKLKRQQKSVESNETSNSCEQKPPPEPKETEKSEPNHEIGNMTTITPVSEDEFEDAEDGEPELPVTSPTDEPEDSGDKNHTKDDVTETLNFLGNLRKTLENELAESQSLFEQQMSQLDQYLYY